MIWDQEVSLNNGKTLYTYNGSNYYEWSLGNLCLKAFTNNHKNPEVKSYTLTFDPNGGNVNETSRKRNEGSQYGILPTPTRTGYTFTGWFTSTNGGNEVSSSTTISSNTTIYAQWTINVYTLNYNPNGGNVTPTSKNLNYGSAYGNLPTPTRSGYIFNGWYSALNNGSKVSNNTVITNDTTIYANWKKMKR